jgi:hypothetical protein
MTSVTACHLFAYTCFAPHLHLHSCCHSIHFLLNFIFISILALFFACSLSHMHVPACLTTACQFDTMPFGPTTIACPLMPCLHPGPYQHTHTHATRLVWMNCLSSRSPPAPVTLVSPPCAPAHPRTHRCPSTPLPRSGFHSLASTLTFFAIVLFHFAAHYSNEATLC